MGAVLAAAGLAQHPSDRIGEIEFFGYSGFDVEAIRKALPLHEGDVIPDSAGGLKQTIQQITGTEPTDIAGGCCDDKGRSMVYIGLGGTSSRNFEYNPVPKGASRFPKSVTKLYDDAMEALFNAVQKGAGAEDDSQGYALSTADSTLRSKQLAMRQYAVSHQPQILEVLETSSDAQQRIVAAELLGYSERSKKQVEALVHASRDADGTVRNNAIRALDVLVSSSPKIGGDIPASDFIPMLWSGKWLDRNKGARLMELMTADRDPKLLARLRTEAVDPLLEMARWRSPGHAYSARVLLGRIAGIDEVRLTKLIDGGELKPIFDALQAR